MSRSIQSFFSFPRSLYLETSTRLAHIPGSLLTFLKQVAFNRIFLRSRFSVLVSSAFEVVPSDVHQLELESSLYTLFGSNNVF